MRRCEGLLGGYAEGGTAVRYSHPGEDALQVVEETVTDWKSAARQSPVIGSAMVPIPCAI